MNFLTPEFLAQALDLINLLALLFMAISIVATVAVRFTKTQADDLFVESAAAKFLKLMSYLPTVGINPRTKAMEAALKDLQEQNKAINAKIS